MLLGFYITKNLYFIYEKIKKNKKSKIYILTHSSL